MIALDTRQQRIGYALEMQPIAVSKIYQRLWPGATIHQGDIESDALSVALDRVGNTDKTIITRSAVIHVAQRIRQENVWWDYNGRYRDFTIREAEHNRFVSAEENGGMLPGFYAYGYATATYDDFLRFFVVRFPQWFRYVKRQDMIPPNHRLQFKDMRGKQENFYYVSWSNIPAEYIVLRYIRGMTEAIQPLVNGRTETIQLTLWS